MEELRFKHQNDKIDCSDIAKKRGGGGHKGAAGFTCKDIRDFDEIFNTHKIKHVINFAAESHVDRSILSSELFFQTNVLGTHVLLEASRKYDIERYVQISTDEVYGSLGKEGVFHHSRRTVLMPPQKFLLILWLWHLNTHMIYR